MTAKEAAALSETNLLTAIDSVKEDFAREIMGAVAMGRRSTTIYHSQARRVKAEMIRWLGELGYRVTWDEGVDAAKVQVSW
jgi:hypothetical protein